MAYHIRRRVRLNRDNKMVALRPTSIRGTYAKRHQGWGVPWRRLLEARMPTPGQLVWFGALVAALGAISGQSLWIDETSSAVRASEPSFVRLIDWMLSDGGSDAQMPFYLAAVWLWEKAAGHGEFALRLFNLLWFLPGLYFFANGRPARIVVASVSAFVWYCLDEARPYGMELGARLLVFGLFERAVVESLRGDPKTPLLRQHELWLLAISLSVLAGSTLLGAIWAAGAVAAAVMALRLNRAQLEATRIVWPLAFLVVVMVPLAAYYGWTLWRGAGGTRVAETDWRTLGFVGYELFGLAGLGPGRSELRELGIAALAPYGVSLGIASVLTAAVTLTGGVHLWRTVDRRALLWTTTMLASAALVILCAGVLMHWRVVGRHLAPLVTIVLATQAGAWRCYGTAASGSFSVSPLLRSLLHPLSICVWRPAMPRTTTDLPPPSP